MQPLYLISTLADRGVYYRITDGDRVWRHISTMPLPPGFVEYDEFDETKHVIGVAKYNNAPPWVLETLKRFLQRIR